MACCDAWSVASGLDLGLGTVVADLGNVEAEFFEFWLRWRLHFRLRHDASVNVMGLPSRARRGVAH